MTLKNLDLKNAKSSDFTEDLSQTELNLILAEISKFIVECNPKAKIENISMDFEVGPEIEGHVLTYATSKCFYRIPLFIYEEQGFWYERIVAKDRSFVVVQECIDTADFLKTERFDTLDLALNFFANNCN